MELTKTDELPISIPGFRFQKTGLQIDEALTEDDWKSGLSLLQRAEESLRWWVGDWVAFGEKRYGRTYEEIEQITGLSRGSLWNAAYVSGAVEPSRRREDLSWSHHQEVAKLEPEDQMKWLELAESNSMTVPDLRASIKAGEVVKAASRASGKIGTIQAIHFEFVQWRKKIETKTIDWTPTQWLGVLDELKPIVEFYEQAKARAGI